MDIQLIGHSGCKISIIGTSEHLLVKKKSSDNSYNQRLYNQYLQQRNYKSAVFKKADVYQFSEDADGCAFFTMDYINGKTAAEKMRTIELYKIPPLGRRFAELLPNKIEPSSNAMTAFQDKIAMLKKATQGKAFHLNRAFEELESFDWSAVSESSCHGDLTLENMIMVNDEIYLIDFLDSFYNSWAIDLAKILQDADLHWHYRYESRIDNNLWIRLECLKDSIVNAILNHTNGERLYSIVYHILLLNILRIIPYCRDVTTEKWIARKIDDVLGVLDRI